ncbi:amino acid ABC transporter ATP-binding protein [Streptomyces sp. BI20]|uniref:amino acid ABC transporter ATP-binding protein n=1 Tax=Streptomyces sp. BI20 TaxID=3403460 RepID=UPI003C77BB0C
MTTTAPPAAPAAIELRDVHVRFGDHHVLRGVDLAVRPGTATAILGRSGSGKSTLLRVVNHLERPHRGLVRVGGELIGVRVDGDRLRTLPERQVLAQRARIGFVFQNFNLFPHLTAVQNVTAAPLATGRRDRDTVRAEALALLDRVGLADKADAHPRSLSGGQQQRVAIARALALRPDVILFDEPTSALDPELVGEVLDVIADLAADGVTLLIVTHEIGFARRIADEIVFLDEGRIVEQGPPEAVLDHPAHPSTREFLDRVL